MGCFGTSGFLSKVPIKYGQRVVCFIASVNDNFNIRETYYPDSIVAPYCLPIRGEYNDYGSIENIDRDANVEVIEKYFGCTIEEVLNGVERLLYGHTISDNIRYWSETNDDWHNKEVQQYKNIIPLENCLDEYSYKKMKYQWVLLFEHEEIYDKMADEFKDIKMYGQEANGIDNFFCLVDSYNKFCKEMKKSSVYDEAYDTIFRHSMPNMFKYSYGRDLDLFDIEYRLIKENMDNATDDKKTEIKRLLELMHNLTEISRSKRVANFVHEGSSAAFMAIFRQVDYESLIKLYENCREDLRKFYGIWWFCNSIPMHFGISHTGSQQYDEDLFKRFNAVINNVIDKAFDGYPSETNNRISYLVGRELEDGTAEFQRDTLGGWTFGKQIDNKTCRYNTKMAAWEEIDSNKELDGCLLWKLDETTTVKAVD